jgi:hypothetical protein
MSKQFQDADHQLGLPLRETRIFDRLEGYLQ